ncbi:hypothetical protein L1987_52453 [Smallanthus sonchifolius]|uniref:Uncharacterized protein n=1 Tax=Smallanthus sonchifolius TaxID=185202 RepID=A0ACB9ET92_9ASTR|nr:hypothetical protein L1987_52453 [Smallanthus sonchifolius]
MEKRRSFSSSHTNGFGYKDGPGSRSYAFNGPAATDGEMKRKKRIAEYNMFTTGTKIKSAFKWIKNKFADSKKCIVGTGMEVALDSVTLAIAEHKRKIFYADSDKILLSGNEDTLRIP